MIKGLIKNIFGTKTDREVKRLQPIVDQIRQHQASFKGLSEDALRAKTDEFKERLGKGETLDDILPEAFAAVCCVCERLCGQSWTAAGNTIEWNMVPFDVQLMGGIVLHEGKIAEMATGEGKTLVAVAPLYLNALEEKGAHLVTVNDYLARRDAEWMKPVYEYLGLSVGMILGDMPPSDRQKNYACDITYGTNNEFGFDYLRDNMAHFRENLVQAYYHYAIVDEVDSVLVDESRTPLIIAGQIDREQQEYVRMKPAIERIYKEQTRLCSQLLGEIDELLKRLETLPKGDEKADVEYTIGVKLLQVRKGQPKNTKLMKLLQEVSNVRMLEKAEKGLMIEKKMRDVEDELLFVVDEKGHNIDLTDSGRTSLSPKNPEMFVLGDLLAELSAIEVNADLSEEEKEKARVDARVAHEAKQDEVHSVSQLLRAYTLYHKDDEYLVTEDGKIVIVDEHTGRPMPGRRWSDGLHAAVEAKEGVKVEKETVTLATITLQNFFRMYDKLAGMTGTAETEAQEFMHTYGMEVCVIPTNRPIIRADEDDVIYKTKREKYNALLDEIEYLHKEDLPVLVGTRSVETSELISKMLTRRKISHSVLNAKQHAREAEIVQQAGQPGSVTIATNMAGRGTDIKLGKGVIRETKEGLDGGLQILGTERHESRRIDRQLRGRAGRQGDPGASRFFVSMEDDLMRLFGSDRYSSLMSKLGMKEGEPIIHPWMTRAIEGAQKKVEMRNFEVRKRLLEYDDVMNKQRNAIYKMRRDALLADSIDELRDTFVDMALNGLEGVFVDYGDPNGKPDDWDLAGFRHYVSRYCPYYDWKTLAPSDDADEKYDDLFEQLEAGLVAAFEKKRTMFGDQIMSALTKRTILTTIDEDWRDHLDAINNMRENIWTASFQQKEPLVEYQRVAGTMFDELVDIIYKEAFQRLYLTQVVVQETDTSLRLNFQKATAEEAMRQAAEAEQRRAEAQQRASEGASASAGDGAPKKPQTFRRDQPKIGANDPCPCGSGKKYKKCCGRRTAAVG